MNFNGMVPGASFGTGPDFSGDIEVAGVIKASDGKISAPSYTFTSDLKLGMYKSDTKKISVVSDGASMMDIESTKLTIPGQLAAVTQPFMQRRCFPAQTIPEDTETVVVYNVEEKVKGSTITWNSGSSRWELAETGTYSIQGYHYWEGNAFSGRRTGAIKVSYGGVSYDTEDVSDGTAVATGICRIQLGAQVTIEEDDLPAYVQVTGYFTNDGGFSDPCDVISKITINKTS